MLAECVQCYKWFPAKRKTAKFCSDRCRQRAKRGHEPLAWWREPDAETTSEEPTIEQFLTVVALENPRAFRELEHIKAHYGQKAMMRAAAAALLIARGGA